MIKDISNRKFSSIYTFKQTEGFKRNTILKSTKFKDILFFETINNADKVAGVLIVVEFQNVI